MSGLVSLMYHNVCARRNSDGTWPEFSGLSPSITGYFVDQQTFTRHCAIIAESGRSVGPKEFPSLLTAIPDEQRGPAIQITFDDGWRRTLDLAGPVLEAHRLSALLFVTTDLIGHPDFLDCHQLAAASPTFTIGAHGRTHRLLARLSDADVREELASSKATLEDLLGHEVDLMSFPGGSYDDRVINIARETGYRTLFASEIRVNSLPLPGPCLGRVPIKAGTDDAAIKRFVAGNLRAERLKSGALNAIKRLLGPRGYSAVRSRLLSERGHHREMADFIPREPGAG